MPAPVLPPPAPQIQPMYQPQMYPMMGMPIVVNPMMAMALQYNASMCMQTTQMENERTPQAINSQAMPNQGMMGAQYDMQGMSTFPQAGSIYSRLFVTHLCRVLVIQSASI